MWGERWKSLWSRGAQSEGGALHATHPLKSHPSADLKPIHRHSSGLEQFVAALREHNNVAVLDFAAASQSNISFITNLGHRISSEDFLGTLEQHFGPGDSYDSQEDPRRAQAFFASILNFPPDAFGAALLWDSLEFIHPSLLDALVDRLYYVLAPGAVVLALFHADEKASQIPQYNYRIAGVSSLQLIPRGIGLRAQYFSNRFVERVFQRFASLKFFLTRDNLREVIIRR